MTYTCEPFALMLSPPNLYHSLSLSPTHSLRRKSVSMLRPNHCCATMTMSSSSLTTAQTNDAGDNIQLEQQRFSPRLSQHSATEPRPTAQNPTDCRSRLLWECEYELCCVFVCHTTTKSSLVCCVTCDMLRLCGGTFLCASVCGEMCHFMALYIVCVQD